MCVSVCVCVSVCAFVPRSRVRMCECFELCEVYVANMGVVFSFKIGPLLSQDHSTFPRGARPGQHNNDGQQHE